MAEPPGGCQVHPGRVRHSRVHDQPGFRPRLRVRQRRALPLRLVSDEDQHGDDDVTATHPEFRAELTEPEDLSEASEEGSAATELPAEPTIKPEAKGSGFSLLEYELPGAENGEDSEGVAEREPSPYDRPGRWYVVHTYAGYENKVKSNLESRISSMNMEDRIFEVVIPMEEVAEIKAGKRVFVQRKVFPGYLLCRCDLDDDSWSVIRQTPGVTGFVGPGTKPTPLPRSEVEAILQVRPEGVEGQKRSKPRLEHQVGDTVRVKEGPFADFSGQIAEINEDQLKLKVLVNIFGRETPVEL